MDMFEARIRAAGERFQKQHLFFSHQVRAVYTLTGLGLSVVIWGSLKTSAIVQSTGIVSWDMIRDGEICPIQELENKLSKEVVEMITEETIRDEITEEAIHMVEAVRDAE